MWSSSHRNANLWWPDSELKELQNELKFIKIGSQEAEIALRAGKILIMCIMEKNLKQVWMSEMKQKEPSKSNDAEH
jgi:hypothetical protein